MPRNNIADDEDTLLLALQNMEPCGNCGADGAKVPCMSGCKEVFYCSRECMMHHASAHRLRCRNLRCSKFNDSESELEASSADEDEVTDSEGDNFLSDEDEEKEKEKEKVEKPKSKKKSKRQSINQKARFSEIPSLDPETERRIEEKVLRRLKKQEESRIALAIEQRMKQEKADWRDHEMNRIMLDMREKFENDMSDEVLSSSVGKQNGVSLDALVHLKHEQHVTELNRNVQSSKREEEEPKKTLMKSCESTKERDLKVQSIGKHEKSTSQLPPAWNNTSPAFEAIRVVIWKHNFLPSLDFILDTETGIWNKLAQVDADESFSHVEVDDVLTSLNGRTIDTAVQTQQDLSNILATFETPWTMKFRAKDRNNGRVHDYTVTWSNGPLGVTLKDDCTNEKVPIVNRLTKKVGSVAVKHNIAIGDILVAINNIDTIQLGCSLSMSILKKVQLPAKLRFRGVGGLKQEQKISQQSMETELTVSRPKLTSQIESLSVLRPSEYTVNWGKGPLGLTIIPGVTRNELPVIKKVTGTGNSQGIEKAQVGDFLVSINGRSIETVPFEEVVSTLKSTPKPVHLRFRASTEEDAIRQSSNFVAQQMEMLTSSPTQTNLERAREQKADKVKPVNSHQSSQKMAKISSQATSSKAETYTVRWGSGPLGLTIDAMPGSNTAYIKRIGEEGAAAYLSHESIGDVLTHINDHDIRSLEFKEVVERLKTISRPMTLFFQRCNRGSSTGSSVSTASSSPSSVSDIHHRYVAEQSSRSTMYYDVIWKEGTGLGLTLRSADDTSEYPHITKVTGTGSAAHLTSSAIGDILISIDGCSVHCNNISFESVLSMLKTTRKPITLRFCSQDNCNTSNYSPLASTRSLQPHNTQSQLVYKKQISAPIDRPRHQDDYDKSTLAKSVNEVTVAKKALQSSESNGVVEEEKFSSIHAPFLVQNKLSTQRRQRMLKGLKK